MKRLGSILLVAVIFSGCGTTEEDMNSEQEKMIREGANQVEERNYDKEIAQYFKEEEAKYIKGENR